MAEQGKTLDEVFAMSQRIVGGAGKIVHAPIAPAMWSVVL